MLRLPSRGIIALVLAVAIGLAILLSLTLKVPAQVVMFGFFRPENAESGIPLVANQDNIVRCNGSGNFPLMDASYGEHPNVPLMIYEYTGNEPTEKGQYYLSAAQRLLTPTAGPVTLQFFQRGKTYDIHPTEALIFRCGNGIGRPAQSSSSSSSLAPQSSVSSGVGSSSSSSVSTISPQADLQISAFSVTQVPSPTTIYAESNALFNINVVNNGPLPAESLLTMAVPPTWTVNEANSTPGGRIQNGLFTLNVEMRNPGSSAGEWANFNTGSTPCDSQVRLQATISPRGAILDPNPANNQSTVMTLTVVCIASSSSSSSSLVGCADSLTTLPVAFPSNNYGVQVVVHHPGTGKTYMFNKTRQMYIYDNGSIGVRLYSSNVPGWVEVDAGVAATGTNSLYLLGRGGAIYRYDIGANTMRLATVGSQTRYGGYLAGARAVWNPVDRKAYFFGGYGNGRFLNTILTFDVGTATPALSPVPLPLPLSAPAVVWDSGRNKILVIGGFEGNSTGTGVWSNAVYEFDPSRSTLSRIATLPAALQYPSAVYDPVLRKVYIFSLTYGLLRFDPQSGSLTTSTAVPASENGYGFPVWDTTKNKTILFNGLRNAVRVYNACP